MYGYIYKTTNLITKKIYVGQKKSDCFLDKEYLGSGKHLRNSINKYGENNFIVELLDTASSHDELNQKEKFYIAQLNARDPQVGYNITEGGDVVIGNPAWNKGLNKDIDPRLIQSEETKEKRRDSLKKAYKEGRRTPIKTSKNKGKKRTPEQIEANRQRNRNKRWVNKDGKSITVQLEALEKYLVDGWVLGRAPYNTNSWNKGHTKDTDTRVKAYVDKRCQRLLNGEKLGFCQITTGQHSKLLNKDN